MSGRGNRIDRHFLVFIQLDPGRGFSTGAVPSGSIDLPFFHGKQSEIGQSSDGAGRGTRLLEELRLEYPARSTTFHHRFHNCLLPDASKRMLRRPTGKPYELVV